MGGFLGGHRIAFTETIHRLLLCQLFLCGLVDGVTWALNEIEALEVALVGGAAVLLSFTPQYLLGIEGLEVVDDVFWDEELGGRCEIGISFLEDAATRGDGERNVVVFIIGINGTMFPAKNSSVDNKPVLKALSR